MIDIELLRNDPEAFQKSSEAKGSTIDVHRIVAADTDVRSLQHKSDELRAKQRLLGAEVPKMKGEEKIKQLAELKEVSTRIEDLVKQLNEHRTLRDSLLRSIPNPAMTGVKVSQHESENMVLREWGTKPNIAQPRDHLEIAEALGILDVPRAVKTSGTRFVALRGAGAELEIALVMFAKKHLIKAGFEFVLPPVLIKKEYMQAMGYLDGGGESETYHFPKDDLYLVGTAEQALGPMYAEEVFEEGALPKRLLGFSRSFRREAGTYGKEDRGFMRVHEFDKVEMFSFTAPEDSEAEHLRFLSWQEALVQALELPYRVVDVVSGALGHPAARKYDIEVWIPSQGKYRETHSTSNTTDFQTRRLNVRIQRGKGTVLAHAVNGTAIAMSRAFVALVENGQQPDGSVKLPKALKPFLGYDRIRPAK